MYKYPTGNTQKSTRNPPKMLKKFGPNAIGPRKQHRRSERRQRRQAVGSAGSRNAGSRQAAQAVGSAGRQSAGSAGSRQAAQAVGRQRR